MSYVHGVSDTPLRGDTIGQVLVDTARNYGAQEALIVPYQDVHWTYSDLYDRVEALASGFTQLGLKPGDRVGFIAK